jgi:hypothetical protein
MLLVLKKNSGSQSLRIYLHSFEHDKEVCSQNCDQIGALVLVKSWCRSPQSENFNCFSPFSVSSYSDK